MNIFRRSLTVKAGEYVAFRAQYVPLDILWIEQGNAKDKDLFFAERFMSLWSDLTIDFVDGKTPVNLVRALVKSRAENLFKDEIKNIKLIDEYLIQRGN